MTQTGLRWVHIRILKEGDVANMMGVIFTRKPRSVSQLLLVAAAVICIERIPVTTPRQPPVCRPFRARHPC